MLRTAFPARRSLAIILSLLLVAMASAFFFVSSAGRFQVQVFKLGLERGAEDAQTRIVYSEAAGWGWRMMPKGSLGLYNASEEPEWRTLAKIMTAPPTLGRFYTHIFMGSYWCAWAFWTYPLYMLIGSIFAVGLVVVYLTWRTLRRRSALNRSGLSRS